MLDCQMLGNLPPSMYALSDIQASAENTPSALRTLMRAEPVPDERLDFLCQDHRPASKTPAFLNAGGSAGLDGQDLGNAFLSHISA